MNTYRFNMDSDIPELYSGLYNDMERVHSRKRDNLSSPNKGSSIFFAAFRTLVSVALPTVACWVFLFCAKLNGIEANLVQLIGSSSVSFSIGAVMLVEFATYASNHRSKMLTATSALFVLLIFLAGSGMFLHEVVSQADLKITALASEDELTMPVYMLINIFFAVTTILLATIFQIRKNRNE